MRRHTLLSLALAIFASLLATAAQADWPHRHYGHHYRPRTTVELGFYFGPSWVYPPRPLYPDWPRVYVPSVVAPVVVTPPAPPVYVEQPRVLPAVPTLEPGYWYWCNEVQAYYPYVKQCPGSWQKVAPQPPQ